MPYEVSKHPSCPADKPFAVVKKTDGSKMGCHPTKAAALGQMRALYAAESVVEKSLPLTTRANEVTATAAEAVFTTSEDGRRPRAEIVIIRPGQNRSTGGKAKLYTQESIADAVRKGFWSGSPMFIDHGSDDKMPKKRSARDLVGAISNQPGEVWLGQEGEARAMVDFFDPEWAGKVELAKEHMGISNNADVRGRRYRDSQTKELNFQVDEFTNRHSVDWVAFPSAGGGVAQFITATESEEDMGVDWDALTPEMLAEHRPDLVAAAEAVEEPEPTPTPEPEPDPPTVLTAEKVAEIARREWKLAQEAWEEQTSKQADVRAKVGAKLAASGLPAKTRSRLTAQFDGEVEYVEVTVQEAIDEAKAELKDAGVHLGPQPTEFGTGSAGGEGRTLQLGAEALDGAPALNAMAKVFGIKPITTPTTPTGKEN